MVSGTRVARQAIPASPAFAVPAPGTADATLQRPSGARPQPSIRPSSDKGPAREVRRLGRHTPATVLLSHDRRLPHGRHLAPHAHHRHAAGQFELAITLSRRGVRYTQPDTDVLKKLRPVYAEDADALTAASQVIAINFQTVAAANNYWRK